MYSYSTFAVACFNRLLDIVNTPHFETLTHVVKYVNEWSATQVGSVRSSAMAGNFAQHQSFVEIVSTLRKHSRARCAGKQRACA